MASGVGKKLGSLLERTESLEATLPAMANAIQQVVNQLTSRLDNLDRVIMAVVELTGKDAVAAAVEAAMTKEANEAMDQAKANLDQAVAVGQAVPVATVAIDTLVIGQEVNKDGVVIVPGRIQMAFESFSPEIQALLMGKAIGDVVETPSGNKFTVQEIFKLLPDAVPPVQPTVPQLPAVGPVDEATALNEAVAQ